MPRILITCCFRCGHGVFAMSLESDDSVCEGCGEALSHAQVAHRLALGDGEIRLRPCSSTVASTEWLPEVPS